MCVVFGRVNISVFVHIVILTVWASLLLGVFLGLCFFMRALQASKFPALFSVPLLE